MSYRRNKRRKQRKAEIARLKVLFSRTVSPNYYATANRTFFLEHRK